MKRVAITGIGMVTCLGSDTASTWQGLVEGRSGITRIDGYDPAGEKVAVGGEIKAAQLAKLAEALPSDARDRSTRFVHMAVAAGREALKQAGNPHVDAGDKFGVFTGVGYGQVMPSEGYKVGPTTIIRSMPNGAAAWLAILERIRGPNLACSTACASGAHALGFAFDQIRLGRVAGMLAGGVDTILTRDVMRGFAWLRAVNNAQDEEPARMSRPFDLTRRGFVIAEGAAFLVLEELEHARSRGAAIVAELLGWGASSDAFHIVAPAPGGEGMARAMLNALKDAQVHPEAVDYVSAHGTSTPMSDREETRALRQVFGPHADELMVSSQKSMLGHAMGGAGAIEAAVTALTLSQQVVTATINLHTPDPECDLDYVPNESRQCAVNLAISNSFGFGGHNSTLVLRRWQD